MKKLFLLFLTSIMFSGLVMATSHPVSQEGNSINGHSQNSNNDESSHDVSENSTYVNGNQTYADDNSVDHSVSNGDITNNGGVVNTSAADTTHSSTSKNETISRIEQKSMGMVSSIGLTNSGTDMCVGSTSSSVSAMGIGLSHAETVKDTNCELIKLARELKGMGMPAVALALLSQDARVAMALEAVDPAAYKLIMNVDETSREATTRVKAEKLSAHEEREALLKELAELQGTAYTYTAEPVSIKNQCKGTFWTSYCEQKLKEKNKK